MGIVELVAYTHVDFSRKCPPHEIHELGDGALPKLKELWAAGNDFVSVRDAVAPLAEHPALRHLVLYPSKCLGKLKTSKVRVRVLARLLPTAAPGPLASAPIRSRPLRA